LFGVVPERGVLGQTLQLGQLGFASGEVKDAPGGLRSGSERLLPH
jgi:hypothetical protein